MARGLEEKEDVSTVFNAVEVLVGASARVPGNWLLEKSGKNKSSERMFFRCSGKKIPASIMSLMASTP